MKRWKWSSLYPAEWRRRYGDEFDAMTESCRLSVADHLDIVLHAVAVRLSQAARTWPWLLAAFSSGALNVAAREVQYAAGAMLAGGFALAWLRPRRWLFSCGCLYSAIVASSMWGQSEGWLRRAPLYQTAVSLIPALVGVVLAVAVRRGLGWNVEAK